MKKISIILPNYCPDEQVRQHLHKFLDSLEQTDIPMGMDTELIAVENGSEDPRLKEMADIYIHKDQPIGYAKAVNIGLALAEGDYLIIVNNDLILPNDWIQELVNIYFNNGHMGTLAPNGYPFPSRPFSGLYPRILTDEHWFSCVLMNREVFTKVGYLDEQLNYRFHDQDYSIRVKKAGFDVCRTDAVTVQHVNSATYSKMNRGSGENEDPEERRIMVERWGAARFEEWLRINQHKND